MSHTYLYSTALVGSEIFYVFSGACPVIHQPALLILPSCDFCRPVIFAVMDVHFAVSFSVPASSLTGVLRPGFIVKQYFCKTNHARIAALRCLAQIIYRSR